MREIRTDAPPRAAVWTAAIALLVGLLAHTANISSVFRGGAPQIGPFDALYHAARILHSADNPGRVLGFDPARGLHGAFCPWPPLYDAAAGGAARLLGADTAAGVLRRAVWFPPLAACVFAALVAAWMTRRTSTFGGLLAGCGVAFSFPYLEESRVGDIDHHFLEPPLLFGVLAAGLLLRRARGARGVVRYGALFGAALAAALFVQTALLLAAAVSLIAVLCRDRLEIGPRLAGALGFGLAGLAVLCFGLAQPVGYPVNAWYLGIPHAAPLFGAAVACATSALASRREAPPGAALMLSLLVGGLACAAVPSAITGILGGLEFFGGDPWLRSINEFQPLFFQGRAELWTNLCKLGSGSLLLVPLATGASRRRDKFAGAFALFGAAYLLAALSSLRFLVCAGPLLAVVGAMVVARARPSAALAASGAAFLLAPSLWLILPTLREPEPPVGSAALPFYRAAAALHAASPTPQRVLAPWSWGHVLELMGGQAVVVDGFGSSIGRTDFDNALGAVLLPSEDHVAAYCRDNGIRYVVLENPFRRLTVQAESIGLSSAFFVQTPAGQAARIRPLMRFSFWWRAYFDRGREIREPVRHAEAFRNFRLLYSDEQPSEEGSRYRGPAVEVWELTNPQPSP